jgi:hypothetical protein
METYAGLSDEELSRWSWRDPEAFLTFFGRHAAVSFGWLTRGDVESGHGRRSGQMRT